jgi:hypothetical protein
MPRRRLRMREFRCTIYLDKKDALETLIDPQKNYSLAVAKAMFRKFDALVAEAAFADVLTGKQFTTTTTFAADGGLTVAATSGLTYEKLLEIQENFIDNDVGTDMPESMYLTVTGEEHTDLMGETELTSGDFSRQMAVERGNIVNAAGLDIIKFGANASAPILDVTSAVRSCIAATNNGICVGMAEELMIEVDKRPDLNGLTQVQASLFMGAVRSEGALVQKVTTTVS